jgi:hypothetical protein
VNIWLLCSCCLIAHFFLVLIRYVISLVSIWIFLCDIIIDASAPSITLALDLPSSCLFSLV